MDLRSPSSLEIDKVDANVKFGDGHTVKSSSMESLSASADSSSVHESDFSNSYTLFGDGPNVKVDTPDKEGQFVHPEGSLMAFLNDRSEENVEELIKRTTSAHDQQGHLSTLCTILPEIREKIWKHLSLSSDIPNLRLTCKKFRDEIDNDTGIQLYFCDSEEESLRLGLTIVVQRLVLLQLQMNVLGKLILCNPHKLRALKIHTCVSSDAIHEILLRCGNIEHLEINHKGDEGDTGDASFDTEWMNGCLFKPPEEIRYSYGCFQKLKTLRFITSDNNNKSASSKRNLLVNGLLPILHCVNSPTLELIHIEISVDLEDSKLLTDGLFEVFLKCRNITDLRLKHHRSDSYTFEPIPNVDLDRKTSQYVLKFSEHRPFPQFSNLHLEMPENIYGFFDWMYLLKNQRQLRRLTWDIGGNYWLYPVECVVKSARTLEYIHLHMIRCYEIVNEQILPPEPLSLGHFHEFIALKTFHITGTELSSSQFCRMDLLPKNIENLQIECFQISPEHLKIIHKTLPCLRFLSINHWNKSLSDFMASLAIIAEIISAGHGKKYRTMNFLEKSMYSDVEQLSEINQILDNIKVIAQVNNLVVDEISGDNGIGFILVINSVASRKQ